MSSSEVVQVKSLGKKFSRRRDPERTLKSFALGKMFQKSTNQDFWALRDVNFSVSSGETLGIIGANGAGKSTLLSLIAGTTAPTEGVVEVNGRMSSLLELGAGFHPDLTGRENVFLNASILGMSRRETEKKYDEIVELSGIKDAIDSPVKFYSSGMYVRLGFAIAVMCNPDILLMDEVLAVGDEIFRKKSLSKVEQFKTSGKTLLIVSHDLETIKKMADRVLLLNEGKVMELGGPLEVVDRYRNFGIYQDGNVTVRDFGTRDIVIEEVSLKSNGASIKDEINSGASLELELILRNDKNIQNPVIGFGISDNLGNVIFGTNTQILKKDNPEWSGKRKVTIVLPTLYLLRGIYYFSFAVHSQDHQVQYHRMDNVAKLKVASKNASEGILWQPCEFFFS